MQFKTYSQKDLKRYNYAVIHNDNIVSLHKLKKEAASRCKNIDFSICHLTPSIIKPNGYLCNRVSNYLNYEISINYKKETPRREGNKIIMSKLWVSYIKQDGSKSTILREEGHYADILYDLIKNVKYSDLSNFMEYHVPVDNIVGGFYE